GRIELDGRDITALSPSARAAEGLGRSFQDARLFPELTVAETLAIALERWVASRSALSAALHLPTTFESEEQVAARVDELFELIGVLNTQGLAILLVEQNVGQSLQIAHRAYVLENGAPRFSGTPAELLASAELKRAYLGV
ncbi:MAG: branched-chain amino acid ABC transporter ATP-binding protein, partial [Burkholderiaceae bacterium]